MEYARYDNQAPQTNSWAADQAAPIMQQQPPTTIQPPQQPIKPEPSHSQQQSIVYGPQTHQPAPIYDMPVNWAPQMGTQNVIHVPQWPNNPNSVNQTIPMEPVVAPTTSDPCILTPAQHTLQSHYNQYSTMSPAPTYWTNSNMVNTQPQGLTTTSVSIPNVIVDTDPNLIEGAFTLSQPQVSGAIPPVGIPDPTVVPQPIAPTQQQPPNQFDEQLVMPTSSQAASQIPPVSLSDRASLEDALEVIKNHAENFSTRGQNCSSSSGDDDDDSSRGHRGGEREKERRQANNARER